jgi:aminopeptidase N
VNQRQNVPAALMLPAVVVLAVVLLGVAFAGLACDDPPVGMTSAGDPYFPHAGNAGYDVTSYEISLTIDPNSDTIEGNAVVEARASQALDSFSLDFKGLEIGSVKVDGVEAEYDRQGQELIISCPEPVGTGATFSTEISYSGAPESMDGPESFSLGWQHVGDVVYTQGEPLGAATWYPANDHPSDKATYVFNITVPKPYVATASGVLVEIEVRGTDQTFVWEMRQPLASYLAAVTVGEYAVEESTAPNGVPIRNYFAPELVGEAKAMFAETGDVLAYYAELFGPYPFDTYGVVVPDVETGMAMENQTLSLFGRDMLERGMSDVTEAVFYLSHELAHQWFGNSLTVERWQDIWLNEGFATYASWLWFEHEQGPQALTEWVNGSLAALTGESGPPPGDPGTRGLFGLSVYQRGALTLHALRMTVGDDVFFRILREWVSRYEYQNVSTEDFVALAQELAPEVPPAALVALFDAWLYGDELPRLPE